MMKKRIFILLAILLCYWTLKAEPEKKGPARVAFLGPFSKSEFEKKVKPFFKDVAHCEKCELVNLTPYTAKDEIDYDQFWLAAANAPIENSIIYLHWNEPLDDKNKIYIDKLNQKLNQDIILVGYVGQPRSPTGPRVLLNKTILGQLHQAIIIGELTERERLLPQLFYGPEMLTAVKPPNEYLEQGLAPLLFVSELAKQYSNRKVQDWPDYLRRKKAKSKKLWPNVPDLL